MIPSLLAGETRGGVLEYLTTTFALADDEAREALRAFLEDRDHGIFRGPYLRLRTPFRAVEPHWRSPLGWLPAGFRPYLHQARAFERLSTVDGRPAQPTIVTTGTGSGKTESFLIPILDHCRRARATGEDGIKAVLLYPMNALVTDQARRLARLLHDEPALRGVSAAVYIGGQGTHATPDAEHLVDRRDVIRGNPPDILLTNYKMLDFLLLRPEDAALWRRSAASLRFVVLDEFHTYDGAQGTDVAMLLRRLGASLRVAEENRPLGRITPVATSATLGEGSHRDDMRLFAERIFGCPFTEDALVGEDRLDAAEVVADIDFALPVPLPDDVNAAAEPTADERASWAELAAVFAAHPSPGPAGADDLTDPVVLGDRLGRHFVTRAAVQALSGGPLTLRDAVDRIAEAGVLPWGVHKARDPDGVATAVLRFLALLSYARVVDAKGELRPLLHVEVQLWIREISRMLRAVDARPAFAWWQDGVPESAASWLPAAYCRNCGRSGWQAVAADVGAALHRSPVEVWQASVRERHRVRTLLLADPAETGVRYLLTETLELRDSAPEDPDEPALPVLVTVDAEQAAAQRCPACGADDAVRFLGSSVATLVSVALTQLFGSDLAGDVEKKTLVFTDSVQDAAHRAAFIEGRAFQFNLRSVLLAAIGDGPTSLAMVAERLRDRPASDLYSVTPPDFPRRLGLEGEWLARPTATQRRLLNSRLAFQAHLEFGLRSRLGRTLELTGAVTVDYDADLVQLGELARAIHEHLPERAIDGLLPDAAGYQPWLWGLLDRLRTGGGILHDSLTTYIARDGDRYPIWGGSRKGMPKFPRGLAAPTFFTSGSGGRWNQFAALRPVGEQANWLSDWTARALGVPVREGRALLVRVADMLASDEVAVWARRTSNSGATVYGWQPDRILLTAVPDDDLNAGRARLRCGVCRYLLPVPPGRLALMEGVPCPRFRCTGHLAAVPGEPANFYRRMYLAGRVRRIVTHEHTGLLDRELRERVETGFKANTSPIDPNVLACTPTLELGIDIGDLGAVTLASLPRATANYLQRVGRAGRASGNALVLAGVPSRPRDLYFFAEPTHLINGEVTPPGAYLDATELLCRQFLAFCLDRVAAGDIVLASSPPNLIGPLVRRGLEPGGWMRDLLDAVAADATGLAGAFVALFGEHLHSASQATVRAFAAGEMAALVARVFADWRRREHDLRDRIVRLQAEINKLDAQGHLDDEQRSDLRRWIGERKAIRDMLDRMTGEAMLTGLEQLGLLPNYTLLDDTTVLDVSLWWTTDDGEKEYQTAEYSYERGSMTAIGELAPGASFYAHGQRVRIDAVDIGPRNEPHWQVWRLCPDCGWGAPDGAGAAAVPSCPRCDSRRVADTGAVHRLLPLRRVSALHNRDEVVIDDDADDRQRVPFWMVTSVDVDPAQVVRAWRLRGQAFGAEYVRHAVVRRINAGPRARAGQRLSIAGEEVMIPGFSTCVYCGVVDGSQSDDPRHVTRHRGWCVTRREAPLAWEKLLLHHDLATQAVRLLLPVSTLLVEPRLVSFKGALLLGLRHDFGGDPQHLRVESASMPDQGGGTRRYLVLHDLVPGGTGYLDRIGDPDRMRALLVAARDQLAACPCRLEERAACHRCLLGVVDAGEVESADRVMALELLNQILDAWEIEDISSVADVAIDQVELSEIERRFAELVRRWVTGQAASGSTMSTIAGVDGPEHDVRLRVTGGGAVRWRMQAQVTVDIPGGTRPDYLLTRQDAQSLRIAVYLDGRRYHASPEHNATAGDARIRRMLRAAGYRVWSLTWDDLDAFERVLDDRATDADADNALVDVPTQNLIREAVSDVRLPQVWGNAMGYLLSYLTDPEAGLWAAAAIAAAGALVSQQPDVTVLPRAAVAPTLRALLRGQPTPAAPAAPAAVQGAPGGTVYLAERRSRAGLPLCVVADAEDVDGTFGMVGVLDDRAEVVGGPEHRAHWADWLRWSNLAQFLPRPSADLVAPRRSAAFTTLRGADDVEAALHPLAVAPAAAEPGTVPSLSTGWEDVLDLVEPGLRTLAAGVVHRWAAVPLPEPGLEVGPAQEAWQLELAWVAEGVAVVLNRDVDRDTWLAADGWRCLHWDDGTDPDTAAGQLAEWLRSTNR